MNMNDKAEMVGALAERLRKEPRANRRLADAGEEIRPGQLWLTRQAPTGDDLSWVVLVEEVLEDGLFNVLPCFRWTELAGPDDVILPARLSGAALAVSFELEATLEQGALGSCRERLSEECMAYVRSARKALRDSRARIGYGWGLAYLGEHGVRQEWHEKIHRVLVGLQEPVWRQTFDEDESGDVIDAKDAFGTLKLAERLEQWQMPHAAKTGEEYTPVLLRGAREHEGSPVAKVERFVPIQAGENLGLCALWSMVGETGAKGAMVFDPTGKSFIGSAYVRAQDGGILIFLENVVLPPDARRIESAGSLCIVLET
jgi:hypothetical protein